MRQLLQKVPILRRKVYVLRLGLFGEVGANSFCFAKSSFMYTNICLRKTDYNKRYFIDR